DGDAVRRLEADAARVAVARHPFHPELHLGRRNAEFMLEDTARPQRGSLLIFRYADAAAPEIRWLFDAGIPPHKDLGVKELARGENRKSHPTVVAASARHHQRRERHLGNIEIRKTELPPEQFRSMHDGRHEIDPVGCYTALEDRPRPRVGGDAEA